MIGWSVELGIPPLGLYMLIVAVGFTIGRISWRGLALGPAAGTLVLALALGRSGALTVEEMYGGSRPDITLGLFGFALFIYSVGFDAGPRFFGCLAQRAGWQYVGVGVMVNVLAIAVTVACARAFGFGGAVAAGTLAGAMTSAQTYAAALEAVDEPARLAYSFAVTYPFGIVGVILLIHLVPRVFRYDLGAGVGDDEGEEPSTFASPLLLRAFKVEHETVIGRTLGELDLRRITGCAVTRLLRGATIRVPDATTTLELDDHVMARGTVEALHRFEKWVGPEIYDAEMRRRMPPARAVSVQSAKVAGKSLAELDLIRRYHCLLTNVTRGDVHLEPTADLRLARDDIVHVAGAREDVRRLADKLGRFERSTQETDIAVYAAGILLGIVLGAFDFRAAGFHWTLGLPGGLLVAGLLLGRFRRIGRLSAHVPAAARQLVRDLGVLLFVTEAGLAAGASTNAGMGTPIHEVLITGGLATLIPVVAALLFGQFLLRMKPIDAWGSVCGGMTSTGALVALRRAADSNAPAISYAAAFAMASVLLTLAGPIVVFLCGG